MNSGRRAWARRGTVAPDPIGDLKTSSGKVRIYELSLGLGLRAAKRCSMPPKKRRFAAKSHSQPISDERGPAASAT